MPAWMTIVRRLLFVSPHFRVSPNGLFSVVPGNAITPMLAFISPVPPPADLFDRAAACDVAEVSVAESGGPPHESVPRDAEDSVCGERKCERVAGSSRHFGRDGVETEASKLTSARFGKPRGVLGASSSESLRFDMMENLPVLSAVPEAHVGVSSGEHVRGLPSSTLPMAGRDKQSSSSSDASPESLRPSAIGQCALRHEVQPDTGGKSPVGSSVSLPAEGPTTETLALAKRENQTPRDSLVSGPERSKEHEGDVRGVVNIARKPAGSSHGNLARGAPYSALSNLTDDAGKLVAFKSSSNTKKEAARAPPSKGDVSSRLPVTTLLNVCADAYEGDTTRPHILETDKAGKSGRRRETATGRLAAEDSTLPLERELAKPASPGPGSCGTTLRYTICANDIDMPRMGEKTFPANYLPSSVLEADHEQHGSGSDPQRVCEGNSTSEVAPDNRRSRDYQNCDLFDIPNPPQPPLLPCDIPPPPQPPALPPAVRTWTIFADSNVKSRGASTPSAAKEGSSKNARRETGQGKRRKVGKPDSTSLGKSAEKQSRTCGVCGCSHDGSFGAGKYCNLRCSKSAGAVARWGLKSAATKPTRQTKANSRSGRSTRPPRAGKTCSKGRTNRSPNSSSEPMIEAPRETPSKPSTGASATLSGIEGAEGPLEVSKPPVETVPTTPGVPSNCDLKPTEGSGLEQGVGRPEYRSAFSNHRVLAVSDKPALPRRGLPPKKKHRGAFASTSLNKESRGICCATDVAKLDVDCATKGLIGEIVGYYCAADQAWYSAKVVDYKLEDDRHLLKHIGGDISRRGRYWIDLRAVDVRFPDALSSGGSPIPWTDEAV